MGRLLEESLAMLAREQPRIHARLYEQLLAWTLEMGVDGEHFVLRGEAGAFRVETSGPPAELRLQTSHALLADLLGARVSLAEAVLTDALEVIGTLDSLLVFHDGLVTYLHGAVRCPSFPGLLERFRALRPRPPA